MVYTISVTRKANGQTFFMADIETLSFNIDDTKQVFIHTLSDTRKILNRLLMHGIEHEWIGKFAINVDTHEDKHQNK